MFVFLLQEESLNYVEIHTCRGKRDFLLTVIIPSQWCYFEIFHWCSQMHNRLIDLRPPKKIKWDLFYLIQKQKMYTGIFKCCWKQKPGQCFETIIHFAKNKTLQIQKNSWPTELISLHLAWYKNILP